MTMNKWAVERENERTMGTCEELESFLFFLLMEGMFVVSA